MPKEFTSSYTVEQYKNAVVAAYKLGFVDGQQRRKELLVLLQTTNHRLWEELIELDKKEPLVDCVVLRKTQADHLIKHLKDRNKDNTHSNWIRMLMTKIKELDRVNDNVFQELEPTEVRHERKKKETPVTKRMDEHHSKAMKEMKVDCDCEVCRDNPF